MLTLSKRTLAMDHGCRDMCAVERPVFSILLTRPFVMVGLLGRRFFSLREAASPFDPMHETSGIFPPLWLRPSNHRSEGLLSAWGKSVGCTPMSVSGRTLLSRDPVGPCW